jgi:hypothetical protein
MRTHDEILPCLWQGRLEAFGPQHDEGLKEWEKGQRASQLPSLADRGPEHHIEDIKEKLITR